MSKKFTFEESGDPKKMDISMPDTSDKAGDVSTMASKIDDALKDQLDDAPTIVKPDGRRTMFKLVIHKQSNSDGNRPVTFPNHDGGPTWRIVRGKEYIVPDYVVNILKESSQIVTEFKFFQQGNEMKAIPQIENIPRISFTATPLNGF